MIRTREILYSLALGVVLLFGLGPSKSYLSPTGPYLYWIGFSLVLVSAALALVLGSRKRAIWIYIPIGLIGVLSYLLGVLDRTLTR